MKVDLCPDPIHSEKVKLRPSETIGKCRSNEVTNTHCLLFKCSVKSNSLWPHRLWPTRLLCPWGFPGKNTGVGCHFLLQHTEAGYIPFCKSSERFLVIISSFLQHTDISVALAVSEFAPTHINARWGLHWSADCKLFFPLKTTVVDEATEPVSWLYHSSPISIPSF